MNPDAVEYLEADFQTKYTSGRYQPTMHRSAFEEATVITAGGVTATRYMIELIDDHEGENHEGVCWFCVKK